MSFRGYFPAMGNFHAPLIFGCRWQPNGSSAASNPQGSRFSVARTGVGVYVVTMVDKYPLMVAAFASVNADSPVIVASKAVAASVSSYNATAKTVTITLVDNTGTAVDVPSTGNAYISVMLLFKNSGALN